MARAWRSPIPSRFPLQRVPLTQDSASIFRSGVRSATSADLSIGRSDGLPRIASCPRERKSRIFYLFHFIFIRYFRPRMSLAFARAPTWVSDARSEVYSFIRDTVDERQILRDPVSRSLKLPARCDGETDKRAGEQCAVLAHGVRSSFDGAGERRINFSAGGELFCDVLLLYSSSGSCCGDSRQPCTGAKFRTFLPARYKRQKFAGFATNDFQRRMSLFPSDSRRLILYGREVWSPFLSLPLPLFLSLFFSLSFSRRSITRDRIRDRILFVILCTV